MEAVYYAARANLRRLMMLHPNWTRGQLAQATGMSRSWVDKWKKRLVSVPPDDEQVLRGFSRCTGYLRHPFQNKQGKSCVENLVRDVDKEEKIGVVVIVTSLL